MAELISEKLELLSVSKSSWCILLLGLYIVSAIFSFIQSYVMTNVSQKLTYTMRNNLAKKINNLPMNYFDKKTNGEILSMIGGKSYDKSLSDCKRFQRKLHLYIRRKSKYTCRYGNIRNENHPWAFVSLRLDFGYWRNLYNPRAQRPYNGASEASRAHRCSRVCISRNRARNRREDRESWW